MSAVVHPRHYNKHPSGLECIVVAELMTFNLGNALKYVWRAEHKDRKTEDLQKAMFYIERVLEPASPPLLPKPQLGYAAQRLASQRDQTSAICLLLVRAELDGNYHFAAQALAMLQHRHFHPGEHHGARLQS